MGMFDDLTKERNKAQKAKDKERHKQEDEQKQLNAKLEEAHQAQRQGFDEVNNMVFGLLQELRKVLCPDLQGCILKRADFISAGFQYEGEVIYTGRSIAIWQLLLGSGYLKVSLLINEEGLPTCFSVQARGTGDEEEPKVGEEKTADLTQDVLVESIKNQVRKAGLMLV